MRKENFIEKEGNFIDPEIKKEINKEGWDGQAAVLIGSREELDQEREKLLSEGQCENVGTYLKMHKIISVPAERVPEELKKEKGICWIYDGSNLIIIKYIDSQGNIAEVKIDDFKKVSSLNKGTQPIDQLLKELKECGFRIYENKFDKTYDLMDKMIGVYSKQTRIIKKELEEKLKNKQTEEFDF